MSRNDQDSTTPSPGPHRRRDHPHPPPAGPHHLRPAGRPGPSHPASVPGARPQAGATRHHPRLRRRHRRAESRLGPVAAGTGRAVQPIQRAHALPGHGALPCADRNLVERRKPAHRQARRTPRTDDHQGVARLARPTHRRRPGHPPSSPRQRQACAQQNALSARANTAGSAGAAPHYSHFCSRPGGKIVLTCSSVQACSRAASTPRCPPFQTQRRGARKGGHPHPSQQSEAPP